MSYEKQIAKSLGVTPTGLKFLARLVATGAAPQRGNEATKLERDGLILHVGRYSNFESKPWSITDAGREIVRQARARGW